MSAVGLPGPFERALSYWRRFGLRATLRRVRAEFIARRAAAGPLLAPRAQDGLPPAIPTATQWLQARFPALTPLRTYRLPRHDRRRVTLVTDSIGRGSLFGGVGTALILGTLLANRRDAQLRIVTRTEAPVPANVQHVLGVYGIALAHEPQFRFVPADDLKHNLDLLDDELVLTTSWWTTAATLPAVPAARIVYLLQEDERMFYPFGDDRLRCEATLRNDDIRFVVNTRLLFDHFVAEGLDNIARRGQAFEPAFPAAVFHPRARPASDKRRFVFYARPHNARNLFFLGIEVIDAALTQGVIDPQRWEIVFVGKDIPELSLGHGTLPVRRENLNWSDYAELAGSTDLGLSLMYTPHPSYPPLDLVASGAVVVSNRHGPKQDLSALSANLILCEATRDALVAGLARGVALADNAPLRAAQHRDARLSRSWPDSLHAVVEALAGEQR